MSLLRSPCDGGYIGTHLDEKEGVRKELRCGSTRSEIYGDSDSAMDDSCNVEMSSEARSGKYGHA